MRRCATWRCSRLLHTSSAVTARQPPKRFLPPLQRGAVATVPGSIRTPGDAPSQGPATSLVQPPPAGTPAPFAPPPAGPGGLMSVVAEGFSFGVGSSIARHMVDSMFGGGGSQAAAATAPPPADAPPAPAPPADDGAHFFDDDAEPSGGSGGDSSWSDFFGGDD